MADPQIIRISRSDSDDGFVLVRAAQRSKSSDLDLRLYATEGEAVYKASVRVSSIEKLRAKNNRSSEEEWSTILAYAFHQKPDIKDPNWIKGLKLTASVISSSDDDDDDEEDKSISITFRKKIGDISQKLGSIELRQCEDEISLFDWCGTAVSSATSLQDDLSSLQEKAASLEDLNYQLKHQLDEFIKAKSEHEKQMLAKFAQLLNEKKLKIRNQQRLLSMLNGGSEDGQKSESKETQIKDEPSESPEPLSKSKSKSRPSKRKSQPDSSDDDGFDKMDVEHPKEFDAETQSGSDRETPQPLEDDVETASEDES